MITREKLQELFVSAGYSKEHIGISNQALAHHILKAHYEELENGYRMLNSVDILYFEEIEKTGKLDYVPASNFNINDLLS